MSSQQNISLISQLLKSIQQRQDFINNQPSAILHIDLQMEELRRLYVAYEELRRQASHNTPDEPTQTKNAIAAAPEKPLEHKNEQAPSAPSVKETPAPIVSPEPQPEPQAPIAAHTFVQSEPVSSTARPQAYNITINLGEKDGVNRSIQKSYEVGEENKTPQPKEEKPLAHPIPEPVKVAEQPKPTQAAVMEKPVAQAPAPQAQPKEPAPVQEKKNIPIGEKLQSQGNVLFEKFMKGTGDLSIGERLQQKPIADLKQAIGINEKFLFINELFQGNATAYNEFVQNVNAVSSLEEAFAQINEAGQKFNWNNEKMLPAIEKFINLVQRRFLK